MKTRRYLLAASAAAAFLASPAMAQTVTGTVNVTGNVQPRCSVVESGGSASTSFGGTIALGTLDDPDGTLLSSLEGSSSTAAAGSPVTSRVVCTSATVTVGISANTLANGTRGTGPGTGYANEIDYTAEMQVALAAGGNGTVTYSTAAGGAPSSATIGRLSAAASNVTVRTYAFATKGGAANLLVAGEYASTINVTIQPAA